MALRGQVSGRGGPTGRRNGPRRRGVQRDRQWPGAAQSLDLEEGRLGSEKELGHLTKGHEGQGERRHPMQRRGAVASGSIQSYRMAFP